MLPLLDGKRSTKHVKFYFFLKVDVPAWPCMAFVVLVWPVAMNFIALIVSSSPVGI